MRFLISLDFDGRSCKEGAHHQASWEVYSVSKYLKKKVVGLRFLFIHLSQTFSFPIGNALLILITPFLNHFL